MPRNYNYIFRELVSDKDDIQGHIAYAIYKLEKISHIEKFKEENRRDPTEKEIKSFHDSCCNPVRLEEYKTHAEDILENFCQELLDEATTEIETDYIKKMDERMKDAIEATLPSKSRRYIDGILQSMLGTIFLGIILWYLVPRISEYSMEDLFSQGTKTEQNELDNSKNIIDTIATVEFPEQIKR